MKNMDMRFTIAIGSKRIEIGGHYGLIFEQCREYISDGIPDIIIWSKEYGKTSGSLNNMREHIRKNKNGVVRIDPAKDESLEIQQEIAEKMINKGFLLIHGAAVEKDGAAHVFVAPSGTGKTTRLRFWMELYPNSTIINGDKPMIHTSGSCVLVCGTPWAGKEGWGSNIQVPLRAIYMLERSNEDRVEEISIGEALPKLFQQTYAPREMENRQKKIRMLAEMAGKVHFYRYQSTMTRESVRMAYEAAQAARPIQ